MSWCLSWRSWCAAALSLLIMTMFRLAQHYNNVALICTYIARQEARVNLSKTSGWFAPYLCTGWDIPRRNSFGRDALLWRYSLIKQANWRHIISLWHSWSNFTFSTWWAKHHASQWPRGPRHEMSSSVRKLESLVRIPLKVLMSACVYSVSLCR
jgi:hypothetical protein